MADTNRGMAGGWPMAYIARPAGLPRPVVLVKSVFPAGVVSSLNGLTQAFKPSQKSKPVINADVGGPSLAFRLKSHAKYSRLIAHRYTEIPAVFGFRDLSKILNAVVSPIAIYMVNFTYWRAPVYPHPRHAVSSDFAIKKATVLVTMLVCCGERLFACKPSVEHRSLLLFGSDAIGKVFRKRVIPSKLSSRRAVSQHLSNFLSIHIVSPWQILKRNAYTWGLQHVR